MKAAFLSIGVTILYVVQTFATPSAACISPIPVSCNGDVNAEYSKCGDPCPVTCNNMCKPPPCTQCCLKGGGCRCKKGYVRNIRNKCIPFKDCPKCGKNEFFDCGSACDTTCATLGQKCPIINITCNEKCYCIPGYARDHKNVCIPIQNCPAKTCPINQVFDLCTPSCPPEKTCEMFFDGVFYECEQDPREKRCFPKCRCKLGYIRRETDGDCIKPEQCCTDPNAELVKCPNRCPGGTCEFPEFIPCDAGCRSFGCQCKKGYVKDINEKCILLSKCPSKCKGPNEVYALCKEPCPRTCDSITSIKPQPQCAQYPAPCLAGCNCAPGFVRDENNICVKPEKCLCDDVNAEVVECPNPCPGGTCKMPKFVICLAACKPYGCQCKQGYVKNKYGKCVLLSKCHPCDDPCTYLPQPQ